jgi:tetratricopeptide (TPR) repeat protein
MPSLFLVALLLAADVPPAPDVLKSLWKARDLQDRATLQRIASEVTAQAQKQIGDAEANYRAALTQSALAEVATEVRDKAQAKAASETGMKAAERAVALKSDRAEYHRIWGTLCGQAAAAIGGLGALKYGRCALDEVNKALEIDPKSSINHLSHGVGNYYLPQALGGGLDLAIKDFQQAAALDTKSAEPHLWLGVALRKANRNSEARQELQKAVQLNPARLWAKQQLEKTPAN